MRNLRHLVASSAAAGLVAITASIALAAETTEFRVARQPGLVYLQPVIMEQNKLLEKHAAALGLKDLKVEWRIITSGGVMTEALISGSIDIAITGLSNMRQARRQPGAARASRGNAGRAQPEP
jgi:NitT/TauT family transport system substrate-binding protein